MRSRAWMVAVVFAGVWPVTAASSEGVLEINQVCAEQRGPIAGDETGCFSGDSDGFPVTISESGSYRLTGDLDVSGLVDGSNVTVISVESSDVDIDLNGFSIVGPASCSGIPPTCSGTGSGIGIHSPTSAAVSNVAIHHGTIRGMGSHGVSLEGPNFGAGQGHVVDSVRAVANGGDGIRILPAIHSSILDNVVQMNRFNGIYKALGGSTIRGNSVQANGLVGIWGSTNGVISDNNVENNGTVGIRTVLSLVSHNLVGNNPTGIETENGSGANGPSLVRDNLVRVSTTGLRLTPETGYVGNVLDENATDVVGGVQIGQNLCGTATCP